MKPPRTAGTVRLFGCAATPIPDGRALKLARISAPAWLHGCGRFLSGRQNCRFVGLGSPSRYNLTFVQAVTNRAGRVGFAKSPAHLPASRASRARGLFRAHSIMAKRCEICGKGPVVGRNISHAHNVTPRRFEPNLQRVRAHGERRDPAPARLHALPALGQGRQGRLTCMREAVSTARPRRRSVPIRRRSAPARCSSCRGRSRSTRRPARWSTATSRRRRTASSEHRQASSKPPARRFDHVVRTTVYLADMNDFAAMNEVYATYFSAPAPGPRDRPGRAAPQRRAGRNRRHRRRLNSGFSAELTQARRTLGTSWTSLDRLEPRLQLSIRRAFDVHHAVDTPQRLDHLLQVLHVADLDGHVDAPHLIGRRSLRRCGCWC